MFASYSGHAGPAAAADRRTEPPDAFPLGYAPNAGVCPPEAVPAYRDIHFPKAACPFWQAKARLPLCCSPSHFMPWYLSLSYSPKRHTVKREFQNQSKIFEKKEDF